MMRWFSISTLLLTLFVTSPIQAETVDFTGEWRIDAAASTAIDPWRQILLDIRIDGDDLTLERTVSTGRRTHKNVYPLKIGQTVAVGVEWWTGNRHIGAYMDKDTKAMIRASWLDDETTLRIESTFVLISSQGKSRVRTYEEYRLSPDGKQLTVIQLRSSRERPIVHVFHRVP